MLPQTILAPTPSSPLFLNMSFKNWLNPVTGLSLNINHMQHLIPKLIIDSGCSNGSLSLSHLVFLLTKYKLNGLFGITW